ncbi:MAG: precorrin-3B C(17)-methyltransferase, partial [Rhodospirillales bacterium]|nr:precorrin-3B C(17)-methyltransferase [Rhodospirillales bacterium]MCW8971367.1 precorrin-3B C(17)-methyltransferase [Rhodospirillales bacterium]
MNRDLNETAVVVLGPGGMETARRIKDALPGARIHGLSRRVNEADIGFDDTAAHLRALFANGTGIVGICAAGILIRALGPVLSDKQSEPSIVAVAEDGGAAVPLLGGHHGANDMARRIAHLFGGIAAVTTTGDLRFGVALDEPPAGWRLANPDDARNFMGSVLAGAAVRVEGDIPWLATSTLPLDLGGELTITATHKTETGSKERLVY